MFVIIFDEFDKRTLSSRSLKSTQTETKYLSAVWWYSVVNYCIEMKSTFFIRYNKLISYSIRSQDKISDQHNGNVID